MRKASKRPTARVEDASAKMPGIPPEIAQLIEGHSVRIEPKRYFAKLWMTRLPLVQDQAKQSGRDTFILEPELFERFVSRLLDALHSEPLYSNLRPSDWICVALIDVAGPDHIDEWSFEDDWQTIHLPTDLETPPSLGKTANPNTLSLNVAFRPDPYDPDSPSLEISVIGEAVRIFSELRNVRNRTPSEKRELHRRASKFWGFLSERISAQLGIEGLRGRPIASGHLWAFLRDHQGRTWHEIARKFCTDQACKNQGQHGHACQERFRKAAELFWKRERNEYVDLARAKRSARPS